MYQCLFKQKSENHAAHGLTIFFQSTHYLNLTLQFWQTEVKLRYIACNFNVHLNKNIFIDKRRCLYFWFKSKEKVFFSCV